MGAVICNVPDFIKIALFHMGYILFNYSNKVN